MNQSFFPQERFDQVKKLKSALRRVIAAKETPFYVYDQKEARKNIRTFKTAFKKMGVDISLFFAVKSNPYPGLLKTVVKEGEGIDVSSQRELKSALMAGAKKIVYTGPAKTEKDFNLILKYTKKIIVNIDSFNELELLGKMAKIPVRCGIRIYTENQAGWTKFGIPIGDLKKFCKTARKYPNLQLRGLHFNISFNKTAEKYVQTLGEIAHYFQENFNEKERALFDFIDIGGGFCPETLEGLYPWNPEQKMSDLPNGHFDKIITDHYQPRYIPIRVDPIEKMAAQITGIYQSEILPLLPNAALYAEPGRFICHNSMHIVLKLIDKKEEHIAIADGGNNMIGWEKYQYFYYAPLFSLSQWSDKNEIPFITYGPLCTPDDIWGYYLYTSGKPKTGDIICLPCQGAYTYTLAQEFIKEIPPVYEIK